MFIANKILPAIALTIALSPLAANAGTIHLTRANGISGTQQYTHVDYSLGGETSRGGDAGGHGGGR